MPDPEWSWLLAMCRRWLVERIGHTVEPPPAVPIDPRGADTWTIVERLARVHSVEPILFSLTRRACWEKAYYSHRIRNAEALTVLAQLVAGCTHLHAPIRALKGPAVMADVYRDIGLRPMADLDLLCRPGDLLRVARVARSLGFKDGAPYMHHVVLRYGGDGGGLLELHFDLHREVAGRSHFMDSVWQHQTTATIEEWTIPVMSLEHQLVFDVAHWRHHDFDLGLKHVLDFAGRLLLRQGDIDWPRLTALLDHTALTDDFHAIAGAIAMLLDLPLASPMAAPADAAATRLARAVSDRIVAFGQTAPRASGAGVSRQPGVRRKTSYAWRRLLPPLVAAQAAFDSRTRLHALVYLPVYASAEVIDQIARAAAARSRR